MALLSIGSTVKQLTTVADHPTICFNYFMMPVGDKLKYKRGSTNIN
jgi:hypothetical protein